MYKVSYSGNGQIEVALPSYPSCVVIKHGDYAKLNLSDVDKRVIASLKHLGLSYEEIKKEEKSDKVVEKPVEVKEAVKEEPKKTYEKEDLMKKTAEELKRILKDLGNTDFVGKSKSELADEIIGAVNG